MPAKKFRPHSTEVFKFCRLHNGGKQYQSLEAALRHLQGTFITITSTNASKALRRTGYFPLLAGADVVSRTDTGKIGTLEVTIPDWIFEGVVNHKNPEVLTVNPDYFLIQKGLARFVYRLAQKAAGTDMARYFSRHIYRRRLLGDCARISTSTSNRQALIILKLYNCLRGLRACRTSKNVY